MKAFYIFTALLFKMSIGMAQNELPIVYEINKDTSVYRIDTTQFQILEDIEGKYSIEDVQNEAVAQGFHYDKNFNRNRTASTYWVRMRIKNNLNYEKNLWLFFNFGDFFDVYIFNEKDQIAHLKSGDLLRFSEIDGKEGDKPRFRIPFSIDLNQEIVIYERLNSAPWHQSFAYIYPAFESDEYRKEILYEGYRVDEDWREFLYGGIMIGILLLAACYNLLTYFSIKDKVYLYFGLCLLFFILDRHGENLKATECLCSGCRRRAPR